MRLFKRSSNKTSLSAGRRPLRDAESAGPNKAFSYYANRPMDETNHGRPSDTVGERGIPRRSKLKYLARRTLIAGVSVGLVALILNDLSLSSTPKLVYLSTSASQVFLQDPSVYQQAANKLFQQSFTSRNKLTIDTGRLSSNLQHEFPELSAVSVALPVFGHRPTVYIQPSEPSMVFVTQSSGSFVLNASGMALVPATGRTAQLPRLKVPTVADKSGLPAAVGQTGLPNSPMRAVL